MAFGNNLGKDYPGCGSGKTGFYACHAKPFSNEKPSVLIRGQNNHLAWNL